MKKLQSTIQAGGLTLRNRLVMPPMATAKSAADGRVTEQLCQFYDEKSKGGYIGLIITEHSYVSQEGKASQGQLSIASDGDVEGLRRLAATIHHNGTAAVAQINHAGAAAKEEVTGRPPLGPSATPLPGPARPLARAMTQGDIDKVIDDFARAARRAKEAGFDGVELHSAHGYLLDQFYSPLTNKRTDRYAGSSLDGRIRLHLEIIQAVRQAVGPAYPLALRLGACDYMEGGATLEDSVWAAREFEKAGIDLLDISGGFCMYTRPGVTGQGFFSELTEGIEKAVSIPVMLTGGITDAAAAEELLAQGKADLIGVGRAILKDSDWAKRAMQAIAD